MELEKMTLFPVVRKEEELLKVDWFPATKAFFGPAEPPSTQVFPLQSRKREESKIVDVILVDLGFDLVHGSFDDLVDIMKSAGGKQLSHLNFHFLSLVHSHFLSLVHSQFGLTSLTLPVSISNKLSLTVSYLLKCAQGVRCDPL